MLLVSMFSSEFWDDLFQSILWGLMSGILQIIDSIQSAFFFLVGSETIPITLEDGSIVESTLVDAIFGFSFNNFRNFNIDLNEPIHRAFFATLILFCIILGFSIV